MVQTLKTGKTKKKHWNIGRGQVTTQTFCRCWVNKDKLVKIETQNFSHCCTQYGEDTIYAEGTKA